MVTFPITSFRHTFFSSFTETRFATRRWTAAPASCLASSYFRFSASWRSRTVSASKTWPPQVRVPANTLPILSLSPSLFLSRYLSFPLPLSLSLSLSLSLVLFLIMRLIISFSLLFSCKIRPSICIWIICSLPIEKVIYT